MRNKKNLNTAKKKLFSLFCEFPLIIHIFEFSRQKLTTFHRYHKIILARKFNIWNLVEIWKKGICEIFEFFAPKE